MPYEQEVDATHKKLTVDPSSRRRRGKVKKDVEDPESWRRQKLPMTSSWRAKARVSKLAMELMRK
jgi:hypothetical protein